jgi:hypothetical protein
MVRVTLAARMMLSGRLADEEADFPIDARRERREELEG